MDAAVLVALLAILGVAVWRAWLHRRPQQTPLKRYDGRCVVIFASQRGTARGYAHRAFTRLCEVGADPVLLNARDVDVEDVLAARFLVFFGSTYTNGSPPPASGTFAPQLRDVAHDGRYGSAFAANLRHAVFGLGDLTYGDHFNAFAKDVEGCLRGLGSRPAVTSVFSTEQRADANVRHFIDAVAVASQGELRAVDSDDAEDVEEAADVDMEDAVAAPATTKELLYPKLRTNLTKQGYVLLGTHSAVKLCRWTKAMMRGRGGCYKYTFYGINSHQCMEFTPNLACANKCVFCWRHHTNPVSREFQWVADPPGPLLEQAIAAHQGLVRQLRGVPGVRPDRLLEAQNVRHCALSLVGEPIQYPAINDLVGLMHARRISSFMVTNAQYPDRIAQLSPVTQLYISVDAATKEDLRAIDRPLFDDFWERCQRSVDAIALKPQRTVFRLTLIVGYNDRTIEGYAAMILRGAPDFVEVKGMTYCGHNAASPLTIKNSPYHTDVRSFVDALLQAIDGLAGGAGMGAYALACEHEHSCCVLLAKKTFFRGGRWHTWINYAKFFELAERGTPFTAEEYMCETPPWAVADSTERGFDPTQIHVRRKHKESGAEE